MHHKETKENPQLELSAEDLEKIEKLKLSVLRGKIEAQKHLTQQEEKMKFVVEKIKAINETKNTLEQEIEETQGLLAVQEVLLNQKLNKISKHELNTAVDKQIAIINSNTSSSVKLLEKAALDKNVVLQKEKTSIEKNIASLKSTLEFLKGELSDVEIDLKASQNDLGNFVKGVYRLTFALSTFYVVCDLFYSIYAIKMCGSSINDLIHAWDPSYPDANASPTALSLSIGIPLSVLDGFLNLLLIAPSTEARKAVEEHIEKFGLKNYTDCLKEKLHQDVEDVWKNPKQTLINLGHSLVNYTHNSIGAAADIVGLMGIIPPSPGAAVLYTTLMFAGVMYYNVTQRRKYDENGKDLGKLLASLPRRAFVEGEYALTLNTIIRILSAAGIRGLSFAFLTKQISELTSVLSILNPLSPLTGSVVFYHTLRVRAKGEFDANFGYKDKLVDIFAQRMLDNEVNKLLAFNTYSESRRIYLLQRLKNETKEKILSSLVSQEDIEQLGYVVLMRDTLIKAIQNTQASKETIEACVDGLIEVEKANLSQQALINITNTNLDQLPSNIKLSQEALHVELLKRLLAMASVDAMAFRREERKRIMSETSWKSWFSNAGSNAFMASLRGAFGGIASNRLISIGTEKLLNSIGMDNEYLTMACMYGTDVGIAALSYMLYHNAETNRKLDAEIYKRVLYSDKPELFNKLADKAKEEANAFVNEIKTAVKSRNIAKALSILFTGGSSFMRVLSQIVPVADPFMNMVDQKLLLIGVTLIVAESGFNNYAVWQKDVEDTLNTYFDAITGYIGNGKSKDNVDIKPEKKLSAHQKERAKKHSNKEAQGAQQPLISSSKKGKKTLMGSSSFKIHDYGSAQDQELSAQDQELTESARNRLLISKLESSQTDYSFLESSDEKASTQDVESGKGTIADLSFEKASTQDVESGNGTIADLSTVSVPTATKQDKIYTASQSPLQRLAFYSAKDERIAETTDVENVIDIRPDAAM